MAIKATAVSNDRGIYDFVLGEKPTYLANALKDQYGDEAVGVRVIEPLVGWNGWEYSVEIDYQEIWGERSESWFIGREHPEREEWSDVIAEAIRKYDEGRGVT